MSDIRRAILSGTYEAARAHEELGSRARWDRDGGRIDVFGAIDHFGLPLMFRPMDGLLGAYLVRPDGGVLINTRRPLSVRRYTAAHELGHFRLGHEPSVDGEEMIRRTPYADRVDYDAKEVEADAFAVAFVLPQWLVGGQMRRHGWTPADMREPANIYQLALRVGLSYEATCYALRSYKVIDHAACSAATGVRPKAIKQSIVPDYDPPETWHLDVWYLRDDDNGLFVEASPGDLLEVSLSEHSGGGYIWDVGGLADSDLEVVADRREPPPDGVVGGHVVRRLTARARSTGFGSVRFVERRPWEGTGTAPLSAFQFTYDISAVPAPGLLAAQRERMIGGPG